MSFAFTPQVNAQIDLLSQYGKTVDTVSNTATKYLTSGKIDGMFKSVTVYVDLTEISGTTGGTISIEVSGKGSNYAPFYNSKDTTYTFTAADVTSQSFRFQLYDWGDVYLRVKYTGSGTMSTKISAYYIARK